MMPTTRARLALFAAVFLATGGLCPGPSGGFSTANAQAVDPVAARPAPEPAPSSVAAWSILLLPAVLVGFIYVMMRRQKSVLGHVDESMVISRRLLQLSEESVALQKETVRLLERLSGGRPGS